MANELSLTCYIHPSMKDLQWFDAKSAPFVVPPTMSISTLMEMAEGVVEKKGAERKEPFQFQIQVLWNTNNQKKALNPSTTVGESFASGDTFGIYGDIMAAEDNVEVPESDKLPVTILTGFLGSGKTTLLNYILQEQTEKKIAIIENEFGEVSIDDDLLKTNKNHLAEKVIVMDNGCMCCTVRGDLLDGLKSILDERAKGKHLDAVMIETTGMADPVPIVRTFMTSEEITSKMRLDGVITVADAKHIIARLDDKIEEGKVNEAYQQVAFCDKMLLNKLDLVTPEEAMKVKDRLRDINAFAKILPAVKSRVKMSELVNIHAHDMKNFVNVDIEKEAEIVEGHGEHGAVHGDVHGGGHGGHGDGHGGGHGDEPGHGGGHGAGHGAGHGSGHGTGQGHGEPPHKKSRHDSRVNSMGLIKEGEILPEKLGKWMQSLGQIPEDKGTIFRIKAILAIKDHPYKHVFHAVMDVSDEDDADEWKPGEKRINKIVFIGKGLDYEFLRKGFEDIF